MRGTLLAFRTFIAGILLVFCVGTLAATPGGFPSRPRFQAVGVNTAAPAAAGSLNMTGSNAGVFLDSNSGTLGAYQLADTGTFRGLFGFSRSASACITGDTANDVCLRTNNVALRFSTNNGTSTAGVVSSSGAWSFAAPSATTETLNLTGASGTRAFSVNGPGITLGGTAFNVSALQQDDTTRRGAFLGYDSSGQIGIVGAHSAGAASTLQFYTFSGASWLSRASVNGSGNWAFQPPSSGTAATFNGLAGQIGVQIAGDFSGNWPLEVINSGGATTGRAAISFVRTGGTAKQWAVGNDADGSSDNSWDIRDITRGVIPFSVASTGNVTIATPSTGVAANVTAASGATDGVRINSVSGAGNWASLSLFATGARSYSVLASTTDGGFYIRDTSAPADRLQITSAGGVLFGSPTGGDKGAGTINAAGDIYVNNSAACLASGANCTTLNATNLTSGTVAAARLPFKMTAGLCDSGTGGSTCTQTVGIGATIAWASNGGTGVGNFTLTGFTGNPTCQATPVFTGGASRTARINIQSSTAVTTVTETSTTGAAVNSQVNVTCVGP